MIGVYITLEYKLFSDIMIIKISSISFKTIDDFLEFYVPSKKMRYLLFQNQWIKIDGNYIRRNQLLVGENLEIKIYPSYIDIIPNDQAECGIEIIYEDPFLVIVNKPSGILVHDDGGTKINLQKMLDSYYKKNGITVHPLHRLDRETTGLVTFSKSPVFQPLFDKMIVDKRIHRKYLAIVDSIVPKEKRYVFTDRIGRNRHDSTKMVVTKSGMEAKTLAVSLGSFSNLSLLKCTLYTGRTHQIRVHLSFHGMPIINDQLYGKKNSFIKEMGLFGNELSFIHPITEETIHLRCTLAKSLNAKVKLFY